MLITSFILFAVKTLIAIYIIIIICLLFRSNAFCLVKSIRYALLNKSILSLR